MKIILDAMGGDNSPYAVIDGVALSRKKDMQTQFVIVGNLSEITKYINEKKYDFSDVQIIDAPEVISCEESPTVAIRQKKNSSLVVSFDMLKNDESIDALISTGSTGAILAGGFLKIGRIKGVSRPSLCPVLPTKKGTNVLIIDSGANVDCKPINLCHFAIMGSIYCKELFGIQNPRVALVNVGTEDTKGNELTKETYKLMQKLPINFIGNMEARDTLSGDYDVLVCDGFTGNVLIKSIEGAASFVMKELKTAFKSSFKAKLGAILAMGSLKKLKTKMDYNKYGGSPLLGCNKTIIKSHGSSKADTILAAINLAKSYTNANINGKISDAVLNMPDICEVENV